MFTFVAPSAQGRIMMKKILIVDDEEKIRELIRINLELAGYECYEAEDGQKAIEKMENVKPDLALLDIMIPIRSGYEIAGNFIKNNIPIIFLTAKDSIVDKVKGLKCGADDYITKPFEAIELLARIETVLRRAGKETELFNEKNVRVDFSKRLVWVSDKEVELTAQEFELLVVLIKNKNLALSRSIKCICNFKRWYIIYNGILWIRCLCNQFER